MTHDYDGQGWRWLLLATGAVWFGWLLLGGDDEPDAPEQVRPHDGPVFSFFESTARPSHKGVDIEAAVGDPLRSPWHGLVQFVQTPAQWARREPGPGYDAGAYIEIRHAIDDMPPAIQAVVRARLPGAEAVVTRHMHLDTTGVERGDRVIAGQIIGTTGRTGIEVSRPHLHFELRDAGTPPQRYGEAIDPLGVVV